jgi:hypothetical protein
MTYNINTSKPLPLLYRRPLLQQRRIPHRIPNSLLLLSRQSASHPKALLTEFRLPLLLKRGLALVLHPPGDCERGDDECEDYHKPDHYANFLTGIGLDLG